MPTRMFYLITSAVNLTAPGTLKASTPESSLEMTMMPGPSILLFIALQRVGHVLEGDFARDERCRSRPFAPSRGMTLTVAERARALIIALGYGLPWYFTR